MARSIITLSADDVRVLKEVVRATKEGRLNTPSRPPADRAWEESQDYQSPEVYIALPTTGAGIPALSGTTPGSATCNIYQIINGVLVTISGITRTVYNLSASALSQDYLTVHRDKFGSWIAASAGGGGTSTSGQKHKRGLTVILGTSTGTHVGETGGDAIAQGTPESLTSGYLTVYELSGTIKIPTGEVIQFWDDGMVPSGGLRANTWIQVKQDTEEDSRWWYDGGCKIVETGTSTGTLTDWNWQ